MKKKKQFYIYITNKHKHIKDSQIDIIDRISNI